MDRKISQVTGRPYKEVKADGYIIREFSSDTSSFEFVWHRDKEDREVRVVKGFGWQFQREDHLPILLRVGDVIQIKKAS